MAALRATLAEVQAERDAANAAAVASRGGTLPLPLPLTPTPTPNPTSYPYP